MLKLEVGAVECGLKPRRTVDEKRGIANLVFLEQLPEIPFNQRDRSCRKGPNVEEFVRARIDGSEQPKPLVAQQNHRFVERHVIR